MKKLIHAHSAKPSLLLFSLLFSLFLNLIVPVPTTLAVSGDLAFSEGSVWFANDYFFEGSTVRIWASVQNASNQDLLGTVRFTSSDGIIGTDQPISALANKTDEVFVDWTPPSYGDYTITATIIPWDGTLDNSGNNVIQKTITVQQDTDHDGIPNSSDPDKDGDGVNNEEDAFPVTASESKDTDGDGQGNNADTDDDNDGTPDSEDEMPEDSRYTKDQDKDGEPDEIDADVDGDELSNTEENELGTEVKIPDTDGDGTLDGLDPFPLDSTEWFDVDGDGTGDNSDLDIDGDDIANVEDTDPSNPSPVAEADQNVMIASVGEIIEFDASASEDDSGIVKYVWQFGEEILEGAQITKSFDTTGLQVATLTVYDEKGQSDTIDISVRVFDYRFLAGAILFSLLLVLLAFYIIYRYNRRALLANSVSEPAKSAAKRSPKKKK